jgi:hypothetical protein
MDRCQPPRTSSYIVPRVRRHRSTAATDMGILLPLGILVAILSAAAAAAGGGGHRRTEVWTAEQEVEHGFDKSTDLNTISPLPHEYIDASALPDDFTWMNVSGVSYLTKSLNQHIPQCEWAVQQRRSAAPLRASCHPILPLQVKPLTLRCLRCRRRLRQLLGARHPVGARRPDQDRSQGGGC